jgi:hypothetical protein
MKRPKKKARAPGRARRNATKDEDDPREGLADLVMVAIERALELALTGLAKEDQVIVLRRVVERLEEKLEAMELERMGVELPHRRVAS